MPARSETIAAFDAIASSSMFRADGANIDLPAALIALADAVDAEHPDSDAWLYLGEFGEFTCADLITGAYWALTEWHAGQYSDTYRAMCALGGIYRPGMECAPTDEDEDRSDYWPYKAICDYFAATAK
jgi:hypothetical protein